MAENKRHKYSRMPLGINPAPTAPMPGGKGRFCLTKYIPDSKHFLWWSERLWDEPAPISQPHPFISKVGTMLAFILIQLVFMSILWQTLPFLSQSYSCSILGCRSANVQVGPGDLLVWHLDSRQQESAPQEKITVWKMDTMIYTLFEVPSFAKPPSSSGSTSKSPRISEERTGNL